MLVILYEGMVDETGGPLVDFSLSPWMTAGKPSTVKTNADDLRFEVLIHTALDDMLSLIPPCPKPWTIAQSKKLLKDHVIKAKDDVDFILQNISEPKLLQRLQLLRGLKKQVACQCHCIGVRKTCSLSHLCPCRLQQNQEGLSYPS